MRLGVVVALVMFSVGACGGAPRSAPGPRPVSAVAQPIALSASAAPAPSPPGLSRPPTATEERLIAELITATEQIRALRFKEPVQVRIQDRVAMRRYVSRAIEQEELVRGRRRYVALGLLDPSLDVRELLESLMEEELVGYYDPKQRLLAVRDDVARSLGRHARGADIEWRATVVHELVHALQDQHLGLAGALDIERTTDGDNAFGALVEGDATLAMLGYVAGQAGLTLEQIVRDRGQLEATLGASPELVSGALKAAPAIVREPLLFRYRAGALFAASLFERGRWNAVDRAHAQIPPDTLTITDPGRYAPAKSKHTAPQVALPDLSWLAPHGYRLVDEDVLGSLEFAVALGLHEPGVDGLMRAWRGDRYGVLEPTSPPSDDAGSAREDASVWCLRFASNAEARAAELRLSRMPDAAGASRDVARTGTMVVVARGLPPALTQALFARLDARRAQRP